MYKMIKSVRTPLIYLCVVRAHGSAASVRVGEVVPLIVPGPDQIGDGLVPVASNTYPIIHPKNSSICVVVFYMIVRPECINQELILRM